MFNFWPFNRHKKQDKPSAPKPAKKAKSSYHKRSLPQKQNNEEEETAGLPILRHRASPPPVDNHTDDSRHSFRTNESNNAPTNPLWDTISRSDYPSNSEGNEPRGYTSGPNSSEDINFGGGDGGGGGASGTWQGD